MAAQFLSAHGLRVIARNWYCRHGEIDLIAQDGDSLVFVEVKQRTGNAFGGVQQSISASKLGKIRQAAELYLSQFTHSPFCRIDAVYIQGSKIEWLKNISH
jgi:putative endonuclease